MTEGLDLNAESIQITYSGNEGITLGAGDYDLVTGTRSSNITLTEAGLAKINENPN